VTTPKEASRKWASFKPFPRKVTSAQRWEIHERMGAGEDPQALAREFGISASYVRFLG